MVVKTNAGNIFDTNVKHIAFAINSEGYNDSGFAGLIASKYWNELANCGPHEIGTVLSKKVGDVTYHALVCHSLKNGWGDDQAEVMKECFNNIPANGETIASIAIGTGFVGVLSGANFAQIACGIHDSNQRVILYTKYSLESILECYNEYKSQKHR